MVTLEMEQDVRVCVKSTNFIIAQKVNLSMNDFLSKCDDTFTKEIVNGKLQLSCGASVKQYTGPS